MVNVVVQVVGGSRGVSTFSAVPRTGEFVLIPDENGKGVRMRVKEVTHEARDLSDGNPAGYSHILVERI